MSSDSSTTSWAQKVTEAAQNDQRKQPWKEPLEILHKDQPQKTDMIDLRLPNHVQSSGVEASSDVNNRDDKSHDPRTSILSLQLDFG